MAKVVFRPSGKTIECEVGDNLLEVARRADVYIEAPCNGSKSCGKCKVKLLTGEVNQEVSSHLSDEDREASEEAEVYSYLDQGRTSATIYKYRVKAYNKVDGKKVYLKESEKLKATTTPLTPNVTVKSSSKKTARLSWTNCSTRATGYKVYMATSKNGTYKLVKTTTAKSFTKYYLTSGKTYYFKVRAYRTVDGKNIYGNYSTIKSIRVK